MLLRSRQSKTAMRNAEAVQAANSPNALYNDPSRFERREDSDNNMFADSSTDPHDLSLALEGSRNSVVDHMLLSLDSLPGMSPSFPAPSATTYQPFQHMGNADPPTPDFSRRRSHTHSASRSSDYDLNVPDTYSSFVPSPPRRDPEGSKYLSRQSHRELSRQSTREHMGRGYEPTAYGRDYTSYGDGRGDDPRSGRHGRNGSNNSAGSGLDAGQYVPVPPRPIGLGDRTSSFEFSQTGPPDQRTNTESILSRGRPVPGGYWHTDSTVEPTIVSTPRRRREPGIVPQANEQTHPPLPGYETDSMAAKPKRRSSIKSATSRLSRRRGDGDNSSRMHVSDVFGSHVDGGTATANDALAAPSPSAGYRKDTLAQGSNQNTTKEKTGFFRRVFGSSKNSAVTTPPAETQDQARPPTQQRSRNATTGHPSDSGAERERPRTQASLKSQSSSSHLAAQMKGQPQPAPPEVPPVPVEHQTLNKKPSSFFRRRKKSVSESRPPVTILQQHPKMMQPLVSESRHTQQSPSISSLRKVMNPYLSDSQSSQQSPAQGTFDGTDPVRSGSEVTTNGESLYGQAQHDERSSRSRSVFSGSHVPYEGATIRPVTSGSPTTDDFPSSVWGGIASEDQRQTAEIAKGRMKLRKSRPSTAKAEDEKFMMKDAGASEYAALRKLSPTQGTFGSHTESERPKTSPTRPLFAGGMEQSAPALPQNAGNLRKGQSGNVRELAIDHSKRPPQPSLDHAKIDRTSTAQPQINENLTNKPHSPADSTFKKQVLPRSNRIWIEDDMDEPKRSPRVVSPLMLPADRIVVQDDGEPVSPIEAPSPEEGGDVFHSATSLPIVRVEGDVVGDDADHNRQASNDTTGSDLGMKITAAESVAIDTDTPQAEDQERAAKIFTGDESVVPKARAAAWLGETSFVAARTRKAYMDLFDWSGLSILNAFRELCLRLIVKAESQQLDRIIDAFSKRWCSCNPSHGFKAEDVVHTITYSILMLNTDLHIADMDSRMTRNEFVRNTLPTIRRIADLAAADGAEQAKPPRVGLSATGDTLNSPSFPPDQPHLVHAATEPAPRQSLEGKRSKNRLSHLPPGLDLATSGYDAGVDNCTVLVNKQHDGTMKSWESQVEVVLREFYNSIKQTRLPLHGSAGQGKESHDAAQNSNNLTVSGGSGLRRTPSVLSKAPSDSISYRGRSSELRSATNRWPVGNKNRSRPRLYPPSTMASSRTSLDDQSVWSPAASSTWSKYSLAKSQTQPSSWNTGAGSMSVESFGSGYHGEGYSQSIGFANALSQAIIREEHAAGLNIDDDDDDLEEFGKVRPLLEDESLELAGAPWAKEGMVKHKHHLETMDKKAKDRAWNECFAVVEKGYLRLFSFNQSSKSMRKSKKGSSRSGGAVGGGNWMDNAESLGCFLLRQTLASSLPPPGYSKQRPHVWALSLPNGAIHLFQVGTDDISNEFVRTANYWSARLSKEPLVGGVSNVEYGWSDNVINSALISRAGSTTPSHASGSASTSTAQHTRRPSVQSSLHGSLRGSSIDGGSSVRARLPGDKATISQWSPPVQSMMASQLMEVDQLKALSAYVRAVEDDLDRHNALRQPMSYAFAPRHPNAQKALANWEKKSAYLLREIVKFKTYVSSLADAQLARERVDRERAERKAVEAAAKPLTADGSSDHYGDELAPETAEAVRRAENAEYMD